jgi:S1-C subfamily serine protease
VRGAATHGVVVSPIGALPEIRTQTDDWLAMSLHLRPGHSGGAVVNTAGELVGINTLMAGPEVGVAVPSHVAVSFVKEMVSELNRRVPRPRSPEGFV